MNFTASHNLIVPKYMIMVKSQGSKNSKARAREGGASAFTALLSFFSVAPSVRPKVLGVPHNSKAVCGINSAKQAGKKEGGRSGSEEPSGRSDSEESSDSMSSKSWGEGIFARLLPFPFCLSKRKAEGEFGGNSAFLLPNQNEASPATCLNTWKAEHHRKILFSLGEKEIRRAQN